MYRKCEIVMLQQGDQVYSHDNGKLVIRRVKGIQIFRKACVTILTMSGRRLRVSVDHPILTQRGWVEAQDLHANHYLIRVCSELNGDRRLPDAELDFITLMLFEGGCSGRLIRFTTADAEVLDVFKRTADALGFGIKQYACNQTIDYNVLGGNSGVAHALLVKHNLRGCLARNKRLPVAFFYLPLDQKYRFLSLMFATDGYVTKRHNQLAITLASEGLIDDISLLLDTCAVPHRKYYKPNTHSGAWELMIGASHVKRLAGKLDLLQKQPAFLRALAAKARDSTIFGYPYEVMKGMHSYAMTGKGRTPAFTKPKVTWGLVGDTKMDKLIALNPLLARWKMDDFVYDRVFKVESSGEDDVVQLEIDEEDYDAKSYVAGSYVVHAKG